MFTSNNSMCARAFTGNLCENNCFMGESNLSHHSGEEIDNISKGYPLSSGLVCHERIRTKSRNPFISEQMNEEEMNEDELVVKTVNDTMTQRIGSRSGNSSKTNSIDTVVRSPYKELLVDTTDMQNSEYKETDGRPLRKHLHLYEGGLAPLDSTRQFKKSVNDMPSGTTISGDKNTNEFNERNGPQIFGKHFKYMKRYLKHSLSSEVDNETKLVDADNLNENINSLSMKLKEELKSSHRKIQALNDMNAVLLRRKGEVQEEVLVAHKEISDLKIALQRSREKQQEYFIEMRIAKERLAEAEREAANAIGNANKVEHRLEEAERKRQTYWEKLEISEQKVNRLEENLSTTKENYRLETGRRRECQQKSDDMAKEMEKCRKEIESLQSKINERDKEKMPTLTLIENLTQEKAKCEGKIEELTKSNDSLKGELKQMQSLNENCERTSQSHHKRVEEQKEKFKSLMASHVKFENEMEEVHKELLRQKKEKSVLSDERTRLMEDINETKTVIEKYKKQCDSLEKENANLKDKLLYLELYKNVIDTKSLTISELKSKTLTETEIIKKDRLKVNPQLIYSEGSENNVSSKLEMDLEAISKKLEEIKGEQRRMHKEVDRTFQKNSTSRSTYSLKDYPCSEGKSPLDMSYTDNQRSIFPNFVAGMNRDDTYMNKYSDLVEADSKNVENALF